MTTTTLDKPASARVRARTRPAAKPAAAPVEAPVAVIEIGSNSGEVPALSPEEAKAEAVKMVTELLALKEASNKAIAAASAAEKKLAKFCKQNEVPSFAVQSGEKIYDVGEIAEKVDEVDPVKLFAEIGSQDFMGLVKIAQGAVKDYGGAPLLAKVLGTVTKPLAFKVKKRA